MFSDGAALARGGDDLLDVLGLGRGEDLDDLGDDGARQRPAGDDARQLPPERLVAAQRRNQQVRDDVGHRHGDQRRHPHQLGQRLFEVQLVDVGEPSFDDGLVEQVRQAAGDDHHDPHREDPDQQLDLRLRVRDGQQDEGDERDARHAVGLEPVGAGADRVAGVVAGAVGDDARVARVVLFDVEDDLHEVRPDVGDLREDAARDAQRGGAQRLADGEPDEAGAGVIARKEEEDAQHHHQLDADEQHADAHPGLQRDGVDGVGLALQAGVSRARVGEGVDADAEPSDAVAAADADQREQQDDGDLQRLEVPEHAEVEDHDDADEDLEQQDELALRDQVGLARLVDQLRDLAHRPVDRHVLELAVNHQPEHQPQDADGDADQQQRAAGDAAEELHLPEVGQHQRGFAALVALRKGVRAKRRDDQSQRERQ